MTVQPETPTQTADAAPELPTKDERIMAALSHVSILLMFLGILAPIFIWVTQREKSNYVRFQALQAITYHLSTIVFYLLGLGCYLCTAIAGFPLMMLFIDQGPRSAGWTPMAFVFGPMALMIGVMALNGVMILYGFVAAILTLQGKDFRYALIGRQVEKFLTAK